MRFVTFVSIFCLIDKIYWAWDIAVSSCVVWGIKLNSNKTYLSREKCQKEDTLSKNQKVEKSNVSARTKAQPDYLHRENVKNEILRNGTKKLKNETLNVESM